MNSLNIGELNKLKLERLQSINPKQEPTRFIKDYGVYECLGSGAFGSVYRVAKRGSTTMYALKEVRLMDFIFRIHQFYWYMYYLTDR